MREAFLDASFAIALSSPTDANHDRALALAERMEKDGTRLVTTRAVILEIGNALAKPRFRREAIALLSSLEDDPMVEIVPLDEDLFSRALAMYRQHGDKEWGLTDCVSFVVMRQRGLADALTADEHFRQTGFRPRLLDA